MASDRDSRTLETIILSALIQAHNRGLAEESRDVERLLGKISKRIFSSYPYLYMSTIELIRQGVNINPEALNSIASRFDWFIPAAGELNGLLFSNSIDLYQAHEAAAHLQKEADRSSVLRGLEDIARKLSETSDPAIAISGAIELFDRLAMGEKLAGGLPESAADTLKIIKSSKKRPLLPSTGSAELDGALTPYNGCATITITSPSGDVTPGTIALNMAASLLQGGTAVVCCTRHASTYVILNRIISALKSSQEMAEDSKTSSEKELSAVNSDKAVSNDTSSNAPQNEETNHDEELSVFDAELSRLIILDAASGSHSEGRLRQVGGTLRRRLRSGHLAYILLGFEDDELCSLMTRLSIDSNAIVLSTVRASSARATHLSDIALEINDYLPQVTRNRLEFSGFN